MTRQQTVSVVHNLCIDVHTMQPLTVYFFSLQVKNKPMVELHFLHLPLGAGAVTSNTNGDALNCPAPLPAPLLFLLVIYT
jgi:hypothetical protein